MYGNSQRPIPQGNLSSAGGRCKGLLIIAVLTSRAGAWVLPQQSPSLAIRRQTCTSYHLHHGRTQLFASGDEDQNSSDKKGGPIDFLLNPYETKIPPELKDEIYRAEANTPAAKDRATRVSIYILIAVSGVLMAFFNALLTEIRFAPLPPGETGDPLAVAGFDWVNTNFLFHFLFTNKIGGALCLLVGAGAGLLAEAELDTKRINAEKIYQELERRRLGKQTPKKSTKKSKKRRSGREQKRLQALSEIVEPEEADLSSQETTVSEEDVKQAPEPSEIEKASETEDEGILGKIKGFYDKADSMAAAQARLLNKELEDKGLVEKITDETGLKVIGREEAARLAAEKEKQKTAKEEESKRE